MTAHKEKKRVPSLRFPEFEGDWQVLPLNNVLTQSKKKNKKLEFNKEQVLSVAAEAGVVNQIEYHGRSYAGASVAPYGIVRKGQMVYTKSPLKAYPYGIIKLNESEHGIVSTLYAIYSVNKKACGKFLDYYFYYEPRINRYLKPLVNIGAKNDMKVNNDYAISDPVTIPPIHEQQKISDFLTSIDTRIQQLTKKVDLLEQYKRGVMQQIFSQEIRFKDDEGRDFPEWEEKRLGDAAKIKRGASPRPISNPKWFDENSTVGWVRISDVTRSDKILKVTEQYLSKKGIAKSRFVEKGNIIMSICATIGKPVYTGFDVCIHDGFVVFDGLKGNREFIYYLLQKIEKRWYRYGQPGIQLNLNSDIVSSELVNIPSPPEQQKIADFLSAIDQKIIHAQTQLEQMQSFKRGLLQQMFI